MELLERQTLLDTLHDDLAQAASGHGVVALVEGEAGSGKTVLIQRFAETAAGTAKVLIGACDAMTAPRPLGPIFDVASDLSPSVLQTLRSPERRSDIFTNLLEALASAERPVVFIIEDIHWADDATVDVLRFLGRRIERTRTLLVLTYRSDEVSGTHPLRAVLGDLATSPSVRRRTVRLLSRDAVASLAANTGIDPESLYTRTGGNPFYVTEVLGTSDTSVPPSVRDAVLARSSRLSPQARKTLEVAAAIGGNIDPRLLTHVSGADTGCVDECIAGGLLLANGDTLQFRHQLGLEAIYTSMSPLRRVELHAAILQALCQRFDTVADYPRLAHHAEGAGDAEAVLRYAPEAGRRASQLGAHREAASQYARALRYADHLTDNEHADLLASWFPQGIALGKVGECAEVAQQLIELARRRGDQLEEANWHAWQAMPLVQGGRNAEADAAIDRAIKLLEHLPPSPVHAHAWSIRSRLRMLSRDYEDSICWGQRAIELAQRFDLPRIQAGALNAMGSSRLIGIDQEAGRADLERGLAIARSAGLHAEAAAILTNLGSSYGEIYRFDYAERYLTEGIAFTGELDLDGWYWYLTSWLALTRMFQGKWDDASDLAHAVIRTPASDFVSRIMARIALGRLRARRGDPEVWSTLDEALDLAAPTGALQRLAPTHAARAEAAWLSGDKAATVAEARAVFDLAIKYAHPWHIGELGYWLWKAGELRDLPAEAAEPYARQVSGDWSGAAELWKELGCPYESARARAESDDMHVLRDAFATFDQLGARPAAVMVARRLREMGADSIPRGARRTTRANQLLLTTREREILSLITRGHTNGEIASHLFLSPKTVERHVSSILAKLDVSSRRDAARLVEERGLLDSPI